MKKSLGLGFLATLLMTGCASGPQGLKARLNKLNQTIGHLTKATVSEFKRPTSIIRSSAKITGLIPLSNAPAILATGSKILGSEMKRKGNLRWMKNLLLEELTNSQKLFTLNNPIINHFNTEPERSRLAISTLTTLLNKEFSLKSTIDPRRQTNKTESSGPLQKPVSPGLALFDPLPIW